MSQGRRATIGEQVLPVHKKMCTGCDLKGRTGPVTGVTAYFPLLITSTGPDNKPTSDCCEAQYQVTLSSNPRDSPLVCPVVQGH